MVHVLLLSYDMCACFVLMRAGACFIVHYLMVYHSLTNHYQSHGLCNLLRDALFCVGCLHGVLFCGVFYVFSRSGVPCGFLHVSVVGCAMIFHGDNAKFAPFHPLR